MVPGVSAIQRANPPVLRVAAETQRLQDGHLARSRLGGAPTRNRARRREEAPSRIASLRHLDDFSRAQALGEWRHGRFDSLADKCVMILGYGHVGEAVDRRLAGFDVDVVRVARTARTSREGDVVHGVDELPALLPSVDVVIVIVPQTPETIGMVDAEFLSRMRPGALQVNVARGPVVVTDDLVAALREGRVRAALDVTDPEPLPPGHPLWSAPGVLISPHVGGNTSAFLPRAHRLVAAQVRRWCSGEPLENAMDRPRP